MERIIKIRVLKERFVAGFQTFLYANNNVADLSMVVKVEVMPFKETGCYCHILYYKLFLMTVNKIRLL